jgi:acyl-CoA thioesterase-1
VNQTKPNPPDCISGFHAAVAVILVLLAGGLSPAPASGGTEEGTRTMVVMGDSLAVGYGLDPSEAFPALLQAKMDKAGLDVTVVNAGLSGDTTAGGLRRIDWMLRRKMDVLLIELGGNDGLRGIPVEETRSNLQGIVDRARAKYPEMKIVIAGMRMPPNMGEEYTSRFREIFPALARRNGAVLIPFLLEGVGADPELNQSDLIHPNAEGQRRVAENVWKVLKPLLEGEHSGD